MPHGKVAEFLQRKKQIFFRQLFVESIGHSVNKINVL